MRRGCQGATQRRPVLGVNRKSTVSDAGEASRANDLFPEAALSSDISAQICESFVGLLERQLDEQ